MKLALLSFILLAGGCVSTSLQFSYEQNGAAVTGTVHLDPSFAKQKK